MARSRSTTEEDIFYSVCYEAMSPIGSLTPSETPRFPVHEESDEPHSMPQRPVNIRRRPLAKQNLEIYTEPTEMKMCESTYDPLCEPSYDAPRVSRAQRPRATESTYENVAIGPPVSKISPRARRRVPNQPDFPIRRKNSADKQIPSKRPSSKKKPLGDLQKNVILRKPSMGARYTQLDGLLSPGPVRPKKQTETNPVFPNFKKTGSIDFDARIYRCNELPRDDIKSQSLIASEENFACGYVNHLGGYIKLLRSQATLFVPPHAILGDPEPIALFFMPKSSQVGYSPLISSLAPDQFLVSPIVFVGKPGVKYSTMDVVLSFPLEESRDMDITYSVLTVKNFDTSALSSCPEHAQWRILAPGHDFFFTVYGGRGVLMVSTSAFYVVRATRHEEGSPHHTIPCKQASTKKLRVALFGRSFPDSRRAKLHLVFCQDSDSEIKSVLQTEEQEGYRKLDHVRALSIRASSGQPIWVTFCNINHSSWRLQTNPTSKFSAADLLEYADQCPPSVTFALEDTNADAASGDAFVQCMVVVHQGASSDYQAPDVGSFMHLVGDVTISTTTKSGQFLSHSLGRASGKKIPVVSVSPNTMPASISPRTSMISSCPSGSPPAVPSVRTSVTITGTLPPGDDGSKARFEEIFMSYNALATAAMLLQDARAEESGRGWKSFARKIGLTNEQIQRLSERYTIRSPLAILHFFFGTSHAADCSTTSLEKARGIFARLVSIFQEMKREDLVRVMRRELVQIDHEVERFSKFLFDGQEFNHLSLGSKGNRNSFSDGDLPNYAEPSSTGVSKSHLWDILSWFKSRSSQASPSKSKSKAEKEDSYDPASAQEFYEVPTANFRVFEERHYDLPQSAGQRKSSEERRGEKPTQKQLNQYF